MNELCATCQNDDEKNGPSVWCLVCKKPCLVEKKIFLRLVSVMAAMVYLSYLVCHTTNLVYVVCMFLPSGSERKQKNENPRSLRYVSSAALKKEKPHCTHTKKINNSNCHVTYTCWPRYTGDFPSAAGLVGLIVSVLNMSEHEFKFLVSVSHSTINVMDWRIFPSAYGHIYKKLIMEQPIIITPPVGTINQNECLSFCSKKSVLETSLV